MRILVTGSRTWSNNALIYSALDEYREPDAVLVHGKAIGVDRIASQYWTGLSLRDEPHRPDWNLYGKAAGYVRNTEMVDLGADVCLAFVARCIGNACKDPGEHGSHGTVHCASEARKAGIPVRYFTPDGEVTRETAPAWLVIPG